MEPVHIRAPKGSIAPYVLAVGDPDRARLLAERLLSSPKLVNEHRGFLVYTGEWNGISVSVAVHGIGGPSAAIVFEELRMYGARIVVRLGTAGSLANHVKVGDVVVVAGAASACGGAGLSGYAEGACLAASPDPILTAKIYEELAHELGKHPHLGVVVTSDSFYAEEEEFVRKWSRLGAVAVEMECATLFALSWMRGFRAAAVLVISDSLVEEKKVFLTTKELADTFTAVARAVLAAIKSVAAGQPR